MYTFAILNMQSIEPTEKWYTHTHTHTQTVLWNQAVHTDRKGTSNRPDIIKKQRIENMHTGICGNTRRQKCCAKGSGKEFKIQEFV